ncbi:MAG: hypothetical protein WCI43_04360 [Candidatus Firestonebacteria bacterium]
MHICNLQELRDRNIFFIDGWHSNNVLMTENSEIRKLLSAGSFRKNLLPCVIDLTKVKENSKLIKDPEELILQSRVKVHGTDGIRGVVSLERSVTGRNFIQLFARENKITPDFIRNAAYAFSSLLLDNGVIKKGEMVLIGEDGRDYLPNKPFMSALSGGIMLAGLNISDAGIMVTPGLPICMNALGIKAAVALTASHNPSNQNGMKLFVNGYKVLPEGPFGDYSITAYLYRQLLDVKYPKLGARSVNVSARAKQIYEAATLSAIPFGKVLSGVEVVFDPANGAGASFGKSLFKTLKMKPVSINDTPRGENINQGGGVVFLEGVEKFEDSKEKLSEAPPAVREMVEKKITYGIVLDGDGDRCYLLAYNELRNAVYVVNGDRLSYLLAKYLKKALPKQENQLFVNTIESDFMAGFAVAADLKIKTRVACVGDKWVVKAIGKNETLLVGAEDSGHIVIPVKVKDKNVYCGNGMLTGLLALALIKIYEVPVREVCSPFDEGKRKTYYTYLSDKKLFRRGSPIFLADREMFIREFGKLSVKHNFHGKIEERIFEDDLDMLYLTVSEGKTPVGALFVRNSGTETKTSVNFRCREAYYQLFDELAMHVAIYHRQVLKARNNPEAQAEKKVLELFFKGKHRYADMKKEIKMDDANLRALLFGMSKEYFEHKEKLLKMLS